jgi:hypothetical protein
MRPDCRSPHFFYTSPLRSNWHRSLAELPFMTGYYVLRQLGDDPCSLTPPSCDYGLCPYPHGPTSQSGNMVGFPHRILFHSSQWGWKPQQHCHTLGVYMACFNSVSGGGHGLSFSRHDTAPGGSAVPSWCHVELVSGVVVSLGTGEQRLPPPQPTFSMSFSVRLESSQPPDWGTLTGIIIYYDTRLTPPTAKPSV